MNTDFIVEDLRGTKNAPADFRLTHKVPNYGTYSLLFQLNDDRSTLALTEYEEDDSGCRFDLVIPQTVNEYVVTTIAQRAFENIHLKELIIPNTIETIETLAFSSCFIRNLFIPASVSTIQKGAFQNSVFYSIKIDEGNKHYDSRNNCNAIIDTANNELIVGSNNSSITIPDTVTSIEEYAFQNYCDLKEIVVTRSVKRIKKGAFYSCWRLEKASIASSIIGKRAFAECWNLTEVLLHNSVTQIGEGAFEDCDSLKEVVIPNSATIIEAKAFQRCRSLEKIGISDSVISIGKYAFCDCNSLEEVVIPNSVISIEESAFIGCWNLKKVVIPNSVVSIGESAFNLCGNLKEVVIPNSVTIIEAGTFKGCENLERLVIPSSVTVIENEAFAYCCNLKEVSLPNSVTKIGEKVFFECNNLLVVDIPDSITYIGRSAFYGCDNAHIRINKPWLLKNAKEEPYASRLSRMDDEKMYLQDPDYLRYILHKGFNYLYLGLLWEFDVKSSNTINEVLLGTFRHAPILAYDNWWRDYLNITFKNIHIFGYIFNNKSSHALKNNLVEIIDLYVDKSFETFTNNKGLGTDEYNIYCFDQSNNYSSDDDAYESSVVNEESFQPFQDYQDYLNQAYHDLTDEQLQFGEYVVGNLDNNSKTFNLLFDFIESKWDVLELLEYSTDHETTVLNGNYQAIVTSNKNADGSICFETSPYLADRRNNFEYLEKNKEFFRHIGSCSNRDTNYFYLASLSSDNRKEDSCLLLASFSVDGLKTNTDLVKVFLSEFKTFLDTVSNLVVNVFQENKRRLQAIEGAISKVMSRNSEHNHGSHVLAHLTDSNSYNRLCDKEIFNSFTSYISNNDVFHEGKDMQLPYFFQYLRNRESYQSETVFGVSNILTSKGMYGDVFKEFDQVRILLNYISGVSDFNYKFKLLVNGEEMNGNNDIIVAMPGDIIGCQAFYVILENVIRNTAKHATKQPGCVTTFTINFSTIDNYPDYYCVEIDNGIEEASIDGLVMKQNDLINESILDDNYNLRNYGLGLIEMETSAAFLRQIPIAKIDSYEYRFEGNDDLTNKQNNLIILKAINKNGALGYRFFLQKPKEILFIGDYPLDPSKQDMMNKEGVQFISEEDFTKAMHDGKTFSHPLLLYADKLTNETKEMLSDDNDCKTLLPIRKVMLSQDEINEVVDIVNTPGSVLLRLKDFAWKKHMQNMGIEASGIHIGENVSRKYSNCRQVVFANHGTKSDHETYWSNKARLPELWVDNLSSYTQNKLPLFAQHSQGGDCATEEPLTRYLDSITPQLQLEIFEAYHNKVVVLDERIQRFALENFEGSSDKEKGGPIPISALFKSTNVIIPETKLDPERFDEASIKEIEKFINEEANGAFLLLHYGILERMCKTEQVITERLETWAKKAKRVVVTSGRGSHSLNLPDSVCFANLSSVLNAFTENRNKYLINCLINQSRRK